MTGARFFALATFLGSADASRIQPNVYLNRQQSSENQQRHLSADFAQRDPPPHGHRKPSVTLATSALSTGEDAVKSYSGSKNQDHHLKDVAHMAAKDVEQNVTGASAGISTTWHGLKSTHLDALTTGISSFLETEFVAVQKAGEVPKKIWLGAIAIAFIALVVCFCGILGSSMLEGSSNASNGRNKYAYKGRLVYEWEQDSTTVTLYTRPPEGVAKANLEVSIYPRHLKIGRRGKPPFMKEELFGVADSGASTWQVSDAGELVICLHKGEEGTEWPCVLLAHHPDKEQRKRVSFEPEMS
jgi:hypothetical protein